MEQFSRFKLLVNDKFSDIANKTILVIGLGGVGSYAVESLVRSGIQNIIIVDNDIIDVSNLNRQLMATYNNIGKYKTDELKERIFSINPKCHVTKINEFITNENINLFNKYKIDYIIDACDTINTKKELIRYSISKNIKLISCMGTGNKMDPSKLKIMDIRKTSYDPIAKIIRKMIKDEHIKEKITVVCSDEDPFTKIDKTIPSNSFVPATAGLLCTSYVINDIISK